MLVEDAVLIAVGRTYYQGMFDGDPAEYGDLGRYCKEAADALEARSVEVAELRAKLESERLKVHLLAGRCAALESAPLITVSPSTNMPPSPLEVEVAELWAKVERVEAESEYPWAPNEYAPPATDNFGKASRDYADAVADEADPSWATTPGFGCGRLRCQDMAPRRMAHRPLRIRCRS
jgi:hypothetical protein